MKKNKMTVLIIYGVIGIVLMTAGIVLDIDYYSSLMVGMGCGLFFSSLAQMYREWRDSRPENAEAAHERRRQQMINLNDERKIQLRHQAGYRVFQLTTAGYFIGAFIAALLRAKAWLVTGMFLFAVVQYIIASVIYRHLEKM